MKRIITLISILFVIVSCASNTEKGKTQLTVIFHDYKKDAMRVYLSDKNGNEYEEMHDVVYMKVLSINDYKNNDYQIEISESPIRNQFNSTSDIKIKVSDEILKKYVNNQFIYSTEIEFIK